MPGMGQRTKGHVVHKGDREEERNEVDHHATLSFVGKTHLYRCKSPYPGYVHIPGGQILEEEEKERAKAKFWATTEAMVADFEANTNDRFAINSEVATNLASMLNRTGGDLRLVRIEESIDARTAYVAALRQSEDTGRGAGSAQTDLFFRHVDMDNHVKLNQMLGGLNQPAFKDFNVARGILLNTALMTAASNGQHAMMDVLIAYGADANRRNLQGDTALHRAWVPYQALWGKREGAPSYEEMDEARDIV